MNAELRELFPHVEVLPAVARLALSESLAVGGRPPALLADEIAQLPLPTEADARRALRTIIESGLVAEALAQAGELRLDEVLPLIRDRDSGFSVAFPARLRGILHRNGVTTWSRLGERTVGEIGAWTNVGPASLANLVGLALDDGLGLLDGASPKADGVDGVDPFHAHPGDDPVPAEHARALAVLLDHEEATGGKGLRLALEAYAAGDSPPEVAAAAVRLLAAGRQSVNPARDVLDRVWEETGDNRDRVILDRRALRVGDRFPMRDLAHALGISRSRVSHLEARAVERARLAATHGPEALRQLTAEVASDLGPVSTHDQVAQLLTTRRLPPVPDTRSLLLLWLAGPYLAVPGHPAWLATDPVGVLADTRRILSEDGGVRPIEQVVGELGDVGFAAPGRVEEWLAEQPVVVVDGLLVARSGTPADLAERLLSATGRAMTAAQLSAAASAGRSSSYLLRAGDSYTGLEGRLRSDRRFVRVSSDQFELAEWGAEAHVDPDAAPPERSTRPGATPGSRAWLRIEIDRAVLSGSSGPVPLPLVQDLGVVQGAHRTFSTRYGPVALSHKATQPIRGSVRPVALAAGASAGDILLLGFDAMEGNAAVELVPASAAAT